jgi:hypothetical protein
VLVTIKTERAQATAVIPDWQAIDHGQDATFVLFLTRQKISLFTHNAIG